HVSFRALHRAHGSVGARHSMIEHHHVVLYDAEPPGFGILSRAGGIFLALQCLALLDIRLGAVESRLFVVPEDETNRTVGLDVWRAEYARELHDERRAGSVVVRGFAPTDSVHVSAHDVHLIWMRGADLGAVDFLTLSGNTLRRVELAQCQIGLTQRIGIHTGRHDL